MYPQLFHNIILFELDFNVKFPLLRLLQFLSDLKSTICIHVILESKGFLQSKFFPIFRAEELSAADLHKINYQG